MKRPATIAEVLAQPGFQKTDAVTITFGSRRLPTAKGEFARYAPLSGVAKTEKDLKPELVIAGPIKREEVNAYVSADAKKLYFDAKTGALIGFIL